MQTLEELKKHFINELVHQDLRSVFYILRQNIDNQCIKYDDLNLLHARYITASHDQNIKGILSSEEARVTFNQINAALLDFINDLTDQDLNLPPAISPVSIPTQVKEVAEKTICNKGKILYKVPGVMELKKERKCIVRIAFDENELAINNQHDEGSKIEPIRIAEVMEVQFIDQCKENAFHIRTISSAEQLIDRGDFTEWIFYVEPLLQGVYDLLLKVSVIEKRLGREIRKDIVMEKKIEVVANSIEINDSLGTYANPQTKIAAGAGFAIPSGFELWDQPVILDSFFIPPLDPNVDIPVPPPASPPPPFVPLNEAHSIGWLVFASAVLLGLVIYFSSTPDKSLRTHTTNGTSESPSHLLKIDNTIDPKNDALLLSVKGNAPPFNLTLKKENNSAFFLQKSINNSGANQFAFTSLGLTQGISEKFEAILTDSRDSQIVAKFPVSWKLPDSHGQEEPTDLPIGIKVSPSIDQKQLDLIVTNGFFPFQISIKNKNDKSQNWTFHIIKTRDTSLAFQSLKNFPKEGYFSVEVFDVSHKMANDNFSLTRNKKDILTLKTRIDKKSKKLKIIVDGNRPPFKVFLDKKQISNYEVSFSHRNLNGKDKVEVKVQDNDGNTKSKLVRINHTSITPTIPIITLDPPITPKDCVSPDQLKKTCSVVYIYNEVTTQNWNMRSKTFSDPAIIRRLNDEYTVYHLNRKDMAKDCGVGLYTNLQDANAFIFNGKNSAPKSIIGYETPNKFYSHLTCGNKGPINYDVNNDSDSDSKGRKRKKSLLVQLEPGVTYQLQRKKDKKGFSIITSPKMYRVQVASFKEEITFNKFVKKLEDIGENVFVKTDTTHLRVYLGGFETRDQALVEVKKLKKNTKLNGILEDEKIPKILVPEEKI